MKDLFEYFSGEYRPMSGSSSGKDYLEDYNDDEYYDKYLDDIHKEHCDFYDEDEEETDLDIINEWERDINM
jgi:hypothetical protein